MYNPDTDLLFPARTLPALRDLRGPSWRDLLASVMAAGPDSYELMAMILLMARLNNCATCNADSYRAMNGCTTCSKQTLKRLRETDDALINIYLTDKAEIEQYLQSKALHDQGKKNILLKGNEIHDK
jgi:hypothetical protein